MSNKKILSSKTPADSHAVLSQYMLPQFSNRKGDIFGGHILSLIDTTAAVCAMRHAEVFVVTAHIDASFLKPVNVGDVISLTADIAYVGKTSMDIVVEVEVEQLPKRTKVRTTTALVTMIAVDAKGKPTTVPPLRCETKEDVARYKEVKKKRGK